MRYEKEAEIFVNAIRKLSINPENMKNLESYLSWHFKAWLEKYADTPEGIAEEMKQFAEMEI